MTEGSESQSRPQHSQILSIRRSLLSLCFLTLSFFPHHHQQLHSLSNTTFTPSNKHTSSLILYILSTTLTTLTTLKQLVSRCSPSSSSSFSPPPPLSQHPSTLAPSVQSPSTTPVRAPVRKTTPTPTWSLPSAVVSTTLATTVARPSRSLVKPARPSSPSSSKFPLPS